MLSFNIILPLHYVKCVGQIKIVRYGKILLASPTRAPWNCAGLPVPDMQE
jgi:hypothetical protein